MPEVKREKFGIDSLSSAERRKVDSIKKPLGEFRKVHEGLMARVNKIGAGFMVFYKELGDAHGTNRVTWPAFVGLFFPDTLTLSGAERDDHPGFRACLFLRRQVQPRGRGKVGSQNRERAVIKAVEVVATLLAWLTVDSRPLIKQAIMERYGMTDAAADRMMANAAKARPWLKVPQLEKKPIKLTSANIVHMPKGEADRAVAEAATARRKVA
jgi:hypothetical protein